MKKHNGFTIVELLIVIVIIGILAAITVVAFSTIRSRAEIAKKEVVISTFLKKSELYKASNSSYPLIDSGSMSPSQINDRYNEMNLGKLSLNIIAGPPQLLAADSPCLQPPMTKQDICIYSRDTDNYKAMAYWDDTEGQWRSRYYLPDQSVQEFFIGSGDYPNADVYDD